MLVIVPITNILNPRKSFCMNNGSQVIAQRELNSNRAQIFNQLKGWY